MIRLLLLPALALLAAFGPGDRSPTQLVERPKSWIPERTPDDPITAIVPPPIAPPLPGSPETATPSEGDTPRELSLENCGAPAEGPINFPVNPRYRAALLEMYDLKKAGGLLEALAAADHAAAHAVCPVEKWAVEINRLTLHAKLDDDEAQLRSLEALLAMPFVQTHPINRVLVTDLEHKRAVLRRKLGLPEP